MLQLLGSSPSDLLKTLAPTSAAHGPRGGETYSSLTKGRRGERKRSRWNDTEKESGRVEAKPHTAALVLQGTQPGSIAEAPNSSNVCSHAIRWEEGGVAGILECQSRDSTALAERLNRDQPDLHWAHTAHWLPGTGQEARLRNTDARYPDHSAQDRCQ